MTAERSRFRRLLRAVLSLSGWWLVPLLVAIALLVLLVLLLDTDRTFPILYPAP